MVSSAAMTPARRLRARLQDPRMLVGPGVFDGLSARIAAAAGFEALYASGGAIARSTGVPDLGLLSLTERQFTPERIARGDIRSLMGRIEVFERPDLTAVYPRGIPTILEIHQRDPSTRSARMDFPPGHSRNPLTDAQIDEKFRRLTAPILGDSAGRALDALRAIDHCPDVRGLMPLLAGAGVSPHPGKPGQD